MNQYRALLIDTLATGTHKTDRTCTGTISTFGRQLRFDLGQGFPLVSGKKIYLRSIFHELMWFLNGRTDVGFLQARDVHIWDAWEKRDGTIGPGYGRQWRLWPKPDGKVVDQIDELVDLIKHSPTSRRMIVTAWNPGEVDEMALPPCHCLFQCYVSSGKLSLQVYQRSCDLFVGVPYNIASYALLTHMLAEQTRLQVGDLVWTGGDCHIYLNHRDAVATYLERDPKPLPKLRLRSAPAVWAYHWEDVDLQGYDPHPAIPVEIAV